MNRRQEMETKLEAAIESGQQNLADEIYQRLRWICECGEDAEEQYDRYGIYCGKMCEKCFKAKYDPNWTYDYLDAGEALEPYDY